MQIKLIKGEKECIQTNYLIKNDLESVRKNLTVQRIFQACVQAKM